MHSSSHCIQLLETYTYFARLRSEFNIVYKHLQNKIIEIPVLYILRYQWSLASDLEFHRSALQFIFYNIEIFQKLIKKLTTVVI